MARGVAEEILQPFEDDHFAPECCEEKMEKWPEDDGAGYITYHCSVCGKVRHFNAHTGADITGYV